jgi:hypothetical protein
MVSDRRVRYGSGRGVRYGSGRGVRYGSGRGVRYGSGRGVRYRTRASSAAASAQLLVSRDITSKTVSRWTGLCAFCVYIDN